MARTGVIICHCGSNIAATVDVERVAEAARTMPGVVFAATNPYTCSQPGRQLIQEAITAHNLDRIVIGSCTPRMHEGTFRKLLQKTPINPYLLEVANLREQCSWVHTDKEKATAKAIDLVRMSCAKVQQNRPLFPSTIPVHKRCLVIGGGIAGVQAALDIAEAGHAVTLVEREPSLGGKMVMLDKTFPTLDCAACIATPKLADAGAHPLITLMTSSEVEAVSGSIGNFQVSIKTRARYVDHASCTGCGLCEQTCPSQTASTFEQGLAQRKAIYKLFPQAVPPQPVIDAASCRQLQEGKCGVCAEVCPVGAIRYDDVDTVTTETFGAIVVATGYRLIPWAAHYPEFGGGRYPDLISGLQFERLVNASGPTEGWIRRPSDGAEPQTVVIVKCVGSRDTAKAKGYCSRACCMAAAKHAQQVLEKIPGARCYVFYIDVRTSGKGYEEFYNKTREDGAVYVRGRVSKIYAEQGKLIVRGEDSLIGRPVSVEADLVILETAMAAADGIGQTAGLLGIAQDGDGWLTEAHPKLKPVETHTGGIYLCGCCQGPKDIPDTVAQSAAAAAKVCGLFSKDTLEISPLICAVDRERCVGCGSCAGVCAYQAITMQELPDTAEGQRVSKRVAQVNSALCQGCGTCAAACRTGSIDLLGSTNRQILEEVDALCLR